VSGSGKLLPILERFEIMASVRRLISGRRVNKRRSINRVFTEDISDPESVGFNSPADFLPPEKVVKNPSLYAKLNRIPGKQLTAFRRNYGISLADVAELAIKDQPSIFMEE
jgi:hypothetical protein